MKKNRLYLITAAVLAVICLIIILFRTGILHGPGQKIKSDIFAVKDTANVTKVFIADMNGETVLLTRKENGWYVQDSIAAMPTKSGNCSPPSTM